MMLPGTGSQVHVHYAAAADSDLRRDDRKTPKDLDCSAIAPVGILLSNAEN
jgi:hypothetical protein